jgi:hypothetical protein
LLEVYNVLKQNTEKQLNRILTIQKRGCRPDEVAVVLNGYLPHPCNATAGEQGNYGEPELQPDQPRVKTDSYSINSIDMS